MSAPPRFAASATAEPANVGPLRSALLEFAAGAGAADERLYPIKLAVSEALSNVVFHAYAGRPRPGPVTVEAWVADGSLFVTITDEGGGLRPRADSPGSGLGLPLLGSMADEFRMEDRTDRPGTCLSLRFALDGSAGRAVGLAP